MASFDADAYAASLLPEGLTVGGRTYQGRPLSAAQWTRALVLLDVAQKKGSYTAHIAVARVVFAAMFDPPWWKLWATRPSRVLLSQPPAVWQAALASFFTSLTRGVPPVTTMASTPNETTTGNAGAAPLPDSSALTASGATTPEGIGQPLMA
jgi:hypothetical protein